MAGSRRSWATVRFMRHLFNPDFGSVGLVCPFVYCVAVTSGFQNIARLVPMAVLPNMARAIFQSGPTYEPSQPRVIDDRTESFVFALLIGEQATGDELVV